MKNNTQLNATETRVLRTLSNLGHVGVGGTGVPSLVHYLLGDGSGDTESLTLEVAYALRSLAQQGLAEATDTGYGLWWRATAEGGRTVGHRRW